MSTETSPIWITDAGLETWLIFHRGVELRDFAAFELLRTADGRAALTAYYTPFFEIAAEVGKGLVLETPTWRASADWGARLDYSEDDLAEINAMAVGFCRELAANASTVDVKISGNIGPRGDGYQVGTLMSAEAARNYHKSQIEALAAGGADLVTAITLGYADEAIGVAEAAAEIDVPCVIGFTVETDGRLPDGSALREAIECVDWECSTPPLHFILNCAHPDHFADVLQDEGAWRMRLKGIRANASRQSHAELDEAETLDDGDPLELADLYAELKKLLPELSVVGGCCGTDHRHVREIAQRLS